MKRNAVTTPVPITHVGAAIDQFEDADWTVRFILFAGFIRSRLVINGSGADTMPVYVLIASRDFPDGTSDEEVKKTIPNPAG